MITRKVWTPVHQHQLSHIERGRIIRSSMFLMEKFLATGEFEKLKARHVAGGHMQNKDLYKDLSASTVVTASVFAILAIAASQGRTIAAVDIGGAFLHADMGNEVTVHMKLHPTLSNMLTAIDSQYHENKDNRGCITVRLDFNFSNSSVAKNSSIKNMLDRIILPPSMWDS